MNAFVDISPITIVVTTRFARMAGLKNGKLLEAAEAGGFDVIVTVDRRIPDQQNLSGRRIALLMLVHPG